MFDDNFGKCGPIFNYFHQLIRTIILYVHTTNVSTFHHTLKSIPVLTFLTYGQHRLAPGQRDQVKTWCPAPGYAAHILYGGNGA